MNFRAFSQSGLNLIYNQAYRQRQHVFLGPRRLSTPLLSATFEKSEARGAADIDIDTFVLKKTI